MVFAYTDSDAMRDGVLKAMRTPAGTDTGHRVTAAAFNELTEHHRPSYRRYDEAQFMRFYLAELLPLAPEAIRVYERGEILKSDYDFAAEEREDVVRRTILNEVGGVTITLPADC